MYVLAALKARVNIRGAAVGAGRVAGSATSRLGVLGQLGDTRDAAAGVDDPGAPGHGRALEHLLQLRPLQELGVLRLDNVHLVVLGTLDQGIRDDSEPCELLRLEAPSAAQERELPQLRFDLRQVSLVHGVLELEHRRAVLFQRAGGLALPVRQRRQRAAERDDAGGHRAKQLAASGHARGERRAERRAQRARRAEEDHGQGERRGAGSHCGEGWGETGRRARMGGGNGAR
mmetsp:Transcript_53693/g.154122  ORF Transcript_53693/g.154122 Transcript_53693/m.154122 type:complete len:231 (+) Transcript_53693:11-703(+)